MSLSLFNILSLSQEVKVGKVRSMFSEAEVEKVGKEGKLEEEETGAGKERQVEGRGDCWREDEIVGGKMRLLEGR